MSTRPCIVTLVCGAAGSGKSSIAVPLACQYRVPIAEADDIVTALTALSTPETEPVLHYWATHPQAQSWEPDRVAAHTMRIAEKLSPGFEAVIADHIAFAAPVVFEGDYLLPELVRSFGRAVRAVVVAEPDEDQVVANFLSREPVAGPQRPRARASVAHNTRLTSRALALGVPVVLARPWSTAVDRVAAALEAS